MAQHRGLGWGMVFAALVVAACGDDGVTSGATDTTSTSTSGTTTAATTTATTTATATATSGTDGDTGTSTTTTTTMGVSESDATTDPCGVGLIDCGGACIDPLTDEENCGGCGSPCAAIQSCIEGNCIVDCPVGQVDCVDVCADLQSDPQHCGECGMACGDGEVCVDGGCEVECPRGQSACDGACYDLTSDKDHCGSCDVACGACQMCEAAECVDSLPPPPAGAIMGETDLCAGVSTSFSIADVPGATEYAWTVPDGSTITDGQGTTAIQVDLGASGGQLCVSAGDGCFNSAPSCVDVTITGGEPFSKTFTPTGEVQDFVVPSCVTEVVITAFGAQGGSSEGGLGAKMSGTFTVSPGELLGVVVGERGVTNACGGAPATGGGGGGSFVWRDADKTEPLIAAGGGGGGNQNWGNLTCRKGLPGVTGVDGSKGNGANSAAGGVGGLGGAGNAPSGTGSGGAGWKGAGQNSTYGNGCTGGQPPFTFTGGSGANNFGPGGEGGFGGGGGGVCGAGGGGGYSGGGAGEGSSCRAGGGGGGSYNAGADQDNQSGVRTGDGEVTIATP